MAVKTLGTSTTSSITLALSYLHGIGSLTPADVASLNNAILDDVNPAHPIIGGFSPSDSLLRIPNRGILKVGAGDWIGVDPNGWPILVSKNSIAGSGWSHS